MTTLKQRARRQEGFTLIELLITILIIGILAAIGLAAYNGQRDKAKDAQAKTAVRNALTAAKTYYTVNQTYNGLTPARLTAEEGSLTYQTTVPTTGSGANPQVIFFDRNGAGDFTTPADISVIRLCSASKSGKIFCIVSDESNGSVNRQAANSITAGTAIASPEPW